MQTIAGSRRIENLKRGVHVMPRRDVRLSLLNGFELTQGGVGIPISSGPQHLLAFLALNERGLRRAQVAGVLWTNYAEDRAAGNLRSALWRLRATGLELIDAWHDTLRLSEDVIVDVREANRLAMLALDSRTDVNDPSLDRLPFGGELLPGWYEDWILLARERQRQLCVHALEALCERCTDAGLYEKAVMAGLAAVESEPLRESANRKLIRAYLAVGNQSDAVRQFTQYRRMLRDELHLEPSARIRDMFGCTER